MTERKYFPYGPTNLIQSISNLLYDPIQNIQKINANPAENWTNYLKSMHSWWRHFVLTFSLVVLKQGGYGFVRRCSKKLYCPALIIFSKGFLRASAGADMGHIIQNIHTSSSVFFVYFVTFSKLNWLIRLRPKTIKGTVTVSSSVKLPNLTSIHLLYLSYSTDIPTYSHIHKPHKNAKHTNNNQVLPDFSDKGNNRARNICIRPQNTVFCWVESLRNKSRDSKLHFVIRNETEKTVTDCMHR